MWYRITASKLPTMTFVPCLIRYLLTSSHIPPQEFLGRMPVSIHTKIATRSGLKLPRTTTTTGASPQPDEVYLPAAVAAIRRSPLVDGLHAGFGVVYRLRSRVARGGWPSRS